MRLINQLVIKDSAKKTSLSGIIQILSYRINAQWI